MRRKGRRWGMAGGGVWMASALLLIAHGAPGQSPGLAARPSSFVDTLLPQPSSLQVGTGGLALTSGFTVGSNAAGNLVLAGATRRMLDALEKRTNVTLGKTLLPANGGGTLTIGVADPMPVRPTLETEESYRLTVTASGVALEAATVFGALHGLETLQQLVQVEDGKYVLPFVTVADTPRFRWRGLMLDVSRHFMPLAVIYRTIDGMATVKLNVLHLHLTDDQGFRLESKLYPQLTATGSDGLFYTQEEMRGVIAYAGAHGIRVVPEFDMPGHVTSWLVGYPELASVPRAYAIARTFDIWDGALDPTKESTYTFLDGFIEEMAALFPDEYLHLGGDESNGKDWKANPAIVAFMQQRGMKTTDELQVYFSTRVLALVKKHHKQMVGWDEILQPSTPRDAVIQSWRGVASVGVAARQGNRSILSAPYYLDAMKTAARMYLDDPLPASLTPAQAQLVLGGEVTMWAEQITAETIDSRVWPRTAALAERFWSPQTTRDVDDLYRRLEAASLRLDAVGVRHLSGPEAGLRALAGSETGAAELGVLTATLTPAPFDSRYKQQKTSQLTPMGNVVDFTRPDPPLRHRLPALVDEALHGTGAAKRMAHDELAALFGSWIESGPKLDALAVDHPLLDGVKRRRQELCGLGLLGMGSLGALDAGTVASAEWLQAQAALLAQAAEPREIVDFAILPPLQTLLDAVRQPR